MVNVLVTGTGGRSVGAGIVQALTRALPWYRRKWRVFAADASRFSWGLYTADRSVILPVSRDDRYIPELNNIIKKYSIKAVIPGSEPEVIELANRRNEVNAYVIANRGKLTSLMADKKRMFRELTSMGINVIPSFDFEDWKIVVDEYKWPLIIKPSTGTGGSRNVRMVFSTSELRRAVQGMDPENIVVQPYIGECDEEYTVGILSTAHGRIIDSIVMKRILMGLSLLDERFNHGKRYAISTGYSQGEIFRHPKLQEYCEWVATIMNSAGPLNLQLRMWKGKPWLFEFHPRFSGTSTIRASAGFNEPDLLLRNFLYGEEAGRQSYMNNVYAIRSFEHVIVTAKQYRGVTT